MIEGTQINSRGHIVQLKPRKEDRMVSNDNHIAESFVSIQHDGNQQYFIASVTLKDDFVKTQTIKNVVNERQIQWALKMQMMTLLNTQVMSLDIDFNK